MKIDRVLLLACDRPDYLKQSLKRVLDLGVEVVAVLDKPSDLARIKYWKKCEEILKKSGVNFIKNKENIGCSRSMFLLLEQRHEGINLIVEDDIVLADTFESEIEKFQADGSFIVKLSSFYWGWLASGLALDTFKAFREQDNSVVDKKQMDSIKWKTIEVFQKSNTFFIWDEFIDTCASFCKITMLYLPNQTENIGVVSSRLRSKSEGTFKTALFKNGVLIELNEI